MKISTSFIKPLINFCGIYHREFYLLFGIVILAFILRIYDLSGESYWTDEFISLRYAQRDLESILSTTRPRLHLLVAHFWIELFGTSEYSTRLLSVFFGTASVLLIYILGTSLFGKSVGLLSAFFMSVSQFQIYYSQEFRYYSLFLLMSLVSFFFYLRVLKARSNIDIVFYTVSTILLYFTQDFAIFLIAVQNVYFMINYKTLRALISKWFISQTIILLCILPRVITNFNNRVLGPDGPNWLKAPEIKTPMMSIYFFFGSGIDYPPIEAIVISILSLLIGILCYIWIIGKYRWLESISIFIQSLRLTKNINTEVVLLVVWIIFPILIILVLSEMIKPMYHHRYMIFISPAFYIAFALILTKIDRIIPISIILISYVIFIFPGLYDYYSQPIKEQWNNAAAYVVENEKPGDLILYINQNNYDNFNWYYKGNSIPCIANMDNRSKTEKLSILDHCMPDVDRIWLILRNELTDSDKENLLTLIKHPYNFIKEKKYSGPTKEKKDHRPYYASQITVVYKLEKVDN